MISFITGNSYAAMLATRAVQLAVMLPVQAAVLLLLTRSKFIAKQVAEYGM